MFIKKIFSPLVIAAGIASFASTALATVTVYDDRAIFESSINNMIIDDFNSASYGFINSAATMKSLSAGSIGYQSTFHNAPNWNLISGNALCWGCNGSGEILLDDTTIGTSDGIYAVGMDILLNSQNLPYDAYVLFGDGSSQNIDLGFGERFFGLTSNSLIKEIHFGLENDVTTGSGSFLVDNVTIGNAAEVPEPAPMALLGLGLIGLGIARKRRR